MNVAWHMIIPRASCACESSIEIYVGARTNVAFVVVALEGNGRDTYLVSAVGNGVCKGRDGYPGRLYE